ncbi:MAG TPA: hypothetical protein VJ875_04520 [Pyrinomonadaceae bacterium]|nr:hypothetical protein [Pyrinomonadaceae bacterium]
MYGVEFGGVEAAVPSSCCCTWRKLAPPRGDASVTKGVHRGFHFRLQGVVADALADHYVRKTVAGD